MPLTTIRGIPFPLLRKASTSAPPQGAPFEFVVYEIDLGRRTGCHRLMTDSKPPFALSDRPCYRFVEASLTCPANRETIAALTCLLRLPHTDNYALADYRLPPLAAILAWHILVFAVYAFVQPALASSSGHQRALPLLMDPGAALAPLGDVLAGHRQRHAQHTVREIAARSRQGRNDDYSPANY